MLTQFSQSKTLMGYFRYHNGGILIIITILTQILLLVFLLSSSKSVDAEDDKTIVQKICSQSLEPEPCVNCILADQSRGTSNISDLSYSILYCMYSQAIYAHDCADHLFQNTAAVRLKKTFQVCKDTMFSASNNLWDALTKLEVSDYKHAQLCARNAMSDLLQCVYAFRKIADAAIPSELLKYMTLAKRLFDVAQYMFIII